MPIPALIPAAIAGAQLVGGLIGRFAGKKRPKYEIPDSAKEALAVARMQAASPYAPGYGQAREGIDVGAANALSAAQMSGNAAAAIQGIMGQRQAANRDLTAQNLQYQSQAQEGLRGELGAMAEQEDRQWQLNEFAPYADRIRLSEDMIGAGAKNLFSSANMMSAMGLFDGQQGVGQAGGQQALPMNATVLPGSRRMNSTIIPGPRPGTPASGSPQQRLRQITQIINSLPRSIFF